MLKNAAPVAAILALSACQVALDDVAPRPDAGHRPSVSQMRLACEKQAGRENRRVLKIGNFRTVTGSRGREIGAASVVTVVRESQVFDIQCNYNFDDRQVRLTEA